ncbi:hypothetical protein V5J35_002178 [Endozoicomonas sp. NE40]|uniref:Uncharacterized protein n=1 Tax=Endozoicomonas lisbonensis TaxID=3120522 RepID=A0ABV2SGT1_9GAMM
MNTKRYKKTVTRTFCALFTNPIDNRGAKKTNQNRTVKINKNNLLPAPVNFGAVSHFTTRPAKHLGYSLIQSPGAVNAETSAHTLAFCE